MRHAEFSEASDSLPNLTQLTHVYGRDHESVLAHCRVRVAYAADTAETAAVIADMAVRTAVPKDPRRLASPVALDLTAGAPAIPRPLVTPHDVLHLPPDDALVFVPGCPPIYGKRIRASLDPEFETRATMPAPTASDRLVHDWSSWTARIAPPVPEAPAVPAEPAVPTAPPDPAPPPNDPALTIPPDEAF